MSKNSNDIAKKIYFIVLIIVFLVSSVIVFGGSLIKQKLEYGYVFHSWFEVTYSVAWVLVIGLFFIIPLSYLNILLGGVLLPMVLCFAYFWGGIGYHEEVRQGEYIVVEIQQLGEKAIRYYEDINIFVMKLHREEYVR